MADPFDVTGASDGSAEIPDNAEFGQDASPQALLKYGTDLHSKVVGRITARVEMSHRNFVSKRQDDWDRVDDSRRLYVNLARPARKGDKTDDVTKKEMPFDRAIVMPDSYAAHEVRKTQMVSQFLTRAPFIQLDGRGAEDMKPAKLFEAKLDYDFQESNGVMALWSLVQDSDAYGIGILHDFWDEVSGWTTKRNPPPSLGQQIMSKFGLAPPPPPPVERVWAPIKQFTRWQAVDPFMFWPDPRVSPSNIQDGEFCGHRSYRSYNWLLERAIEAGGPYFNLEQLKKNAGGASTRTQSGASPISSRSSNRMTGNEFTLKGADDKDKGFYVLDHLEVRISEKEWGLGPEEMPSIWWFTVANESVIVRAHKSEYDHGQYNYSVAEVNPDVHQMANPGIVENLDGLQRMIDWLYNARIENIRKFLHDSFVFSPLHLEEDDVTNPGPARWMRLTAEGQQAVIQGIGIEKFFQQLMVTDVTAPHTEMAQMLSEKMNKLSASNDPMAGQQLPEKRTLGEIELMNQGSNARLSITAKLIDAMALQPLAMRAVSNAQQFFDIEQFIKVTGDLAQFLSIEDGSQPMQRLMMNNEQLQGNFDYVPHSAISPTDPARQMAVLQAFFNSAVEAFQIPGIGIPDPRDGKQLDFRKLFSQVAMTGGVREVDSFFTTMMVPQVPGVMPQEQIDQGVQAGNLVPMEQAPPPGGMV